MLIYFANVFVGWVYFDVKYWCSYTTPISNNNSSYSYHSISFNLHIQFKADSCIICLGNDLLALPKYRKLVGNLDHMTKCMYYYLFYSNIIWAVMRFKLGCFLNNLFRLNTISLTHISHPLINVSLWGSSSDLIHGRIDTIYLCRKFKQSCFTMNFP